MAIAIRRQPTGLVVHGLRSVTIVDCTLELSPEFKAPATNWGYGSILGIENTRGTFLASDGVAQLQEEFPASTTPLTPQLAFE